ncbi:bifunctional hydroxymethylpyrimidine kinase/phosphomethylpyrimidine kinase [Bifidobacterium thermophilum]|uniref:Phosphomethylpyrimidine kinase n=1 Tax=Bifidobacterium thermophilum RBL67 TaxID=1254439 RepID=M4RF69_9BIFI|nr:bifunctional hydroxymethylpyrimidine kinase/phosphomethylpyrimidine kinase [Bifidobacterium thermophilum]AGH40824.1 phosphomethylpyrimidine kinase [Bifidobacterium thermophilum RBL67]MDW8486687.1 bifunctional hydroxymethylpyrimidine kinase/phosphomethylpyrimidine kinase [Bifidobacterium thermophilum]
MSDPQAMHVPAPTTLPAVLTIAGSDCSGGAGIQADLKTMLACGVYGMSAITSITAQNTQGVSAVEDVSPGILAAQLDAVYTDIPPAATKIGMVSNARLIEVIGDALRTYQAANVVLDPVMVSSSGTRLLNENAESALTGLFGLCRLITPNIPEAEVLCGLAAGSIDTADAMTDAARRMAVRYGCAVLVKGGHSVQGASDVLAEPDGKVTWFHGEHIDNPNTHGTGCTLSSAIASALARGETLTSAIRDGKAYLTGAIGAGLDLGHGSGPMDHAWRWRRR